MSDKEVFDTGRAIGLDTEQLEFVKKQTGFYLHELIGKTIIISAKGGITASFRIVGASTDHSLANKGDSVSWCVHVSLEHNVIREFQRTSDLIEIFIFDLQLYIRRERHHDCSFNLLKKNIQTNQILDQEYVESWYTIV